MSSVICKHVQTHTIKILLLVVQYYAGSSPVTLTVQVASMPLGSSINTSAADFLDTHSMKLPFFAASHETGNI